MHNHIYVTKFLYTAACISVTLRADIMNHKRLQAGLFTGVFVAAYGIFILQNYMLTPPASPGAVLSSSDSPALMPAGTRAVDDVHITQRGDIAASTASAHTEVTSTAINSGRAAGVSTQSIASVAPDTADSIRRVADYVAAAYTYANPAHWFTNATGTINSTSTGQSRTNTASTAGNDELNTTLNDAAFSDGSEFLPDGRSQEDLYNAQQPRLYSYSIETYQQASFDCTPGYNSATQGHAALIRQLKGC